MKRAILRFMLGVAVMVMAVVLTAAEMVFARSVLVRMGYATKHLGGAWGALGILNLGLAHAAVDHILKGFGLSRSGLSVERHRPAPGVVDSEEAGEVVDVRNSRSRSNGLTLFFLGVVVLAFVLTELVIPRNGQTERAAHPWFFFAVFLGLGSLSYGLRYIPVIRIDDVGVTAGRGLLGIRRMTVPWDDIASCDLIDVKDMLGEVSLTYPILKDHQGRELFPRLPRSLSSASAADRHRIVRALKHRFPKLEADPLDA